MRKLDTMVVQASVDERVMRELIEKSQFFILKCASATTHRYITKSDDEWSLALMGFTQAVASYDLSKGSFVSFAKLVIHNRLIDYSRSQLKYNAEISVSPEVFDTQSDEEDENLPIRIAVARQISQQPNDDLKYEILSVNLAFSHYGFSLFDLADCSPKAEKTKSACAKATVYLLKSPLLLSQIHSSKQLPIKIIEKNTKVPRKILERHRKYIIAAVEILSGEYPCLAEYMRFIGKELDK
ncbi:MAG: hypothetical protein WAX04_12585 [Oscillospiraceae bacterium]